MTTPVDVPIYSASPDGAPRGGVVVIQEAFGVNDHIEDVTRRFAAAGWAAAAPHLFHRTGDPRLGYDDFSAIMPHMQALTTEAIATDVDAALAALEAQGLPPARCGIVGFCMGGTVALATAARRPLGAAVSFYGGGVAEGRFGLPPLVELAPSLQTPWLGLYGGRDAGIPVAQAEALREAAALAAVPTELVLFPAAEHGFHCDARASYHAESAKDAWARTLAWFDKHIPAA